MAPHNNTTYSKYRKIYLRSSDLLEEAGQLERGKAPGQLTPFDYFYYVSAFLQEGLRYLGKFNRRLSKLVWELHTNFVEIQTQQPTFDATATNNIPKKKTVGGHCAPMCALQVYPLYNTI